jgi:hypothetical protein
MATIATYVPARSKTSAQSDRENLPTVQAAKDIGISATTSCAEPLLSEAAR